MKSILKKLYLRIIPKFLRWRLEGYKSEDHYNEYHSLNMEDPFNM